MSKSDLHYLKAAIDRLDWARRTIQRFHDDAQSFLDLKENGTSVKEYDDGQVLTQEIYYMHNKQVPRDVAFLASDAIHNLRATVDNLVWGLAHKRGGIRRGVYMPFYDSPDGHGMASFLKNYPLDRRFPPQVWEWIESEQLYNRPHGQRSELHCLNKMWSTDKHHIPLVCLGGARVSEVNGDADIWLDLDAIGPLEDGDRIATIRRRSDDKRSVRITVAFDVAFGKGVETTDPTSARRYLWNCHKHIQDTVLPLFEPHLT